MVVTQQPLQSLWLSKTLLFKSTTLGGQLVKQQDFMGQPDLQRLIAQLLAAN